MEQPKQPYAQSAPSTPPPLAPPPKHGAEGEPSSYGSRLEEKQPSSQTVMVVLVSRILFFVGINAGDGSVGSVGSVGSKATLAQCTSR